jgi:hypothetical protein
MAKISVSPSQDWRLKKYSDGSTLSTVLFVLKKSGRLNTCNWEKVYRIKIFYELKINFTKMFLRDNQEILECLRPEIPPYALFST